MPMEGLLISIKTIGPGENRWTHCISSVSILTLLLLGAQHCFVFLFRPESGSITMDSYNSPVEKPEVTEADIVPTAQDRGTGNNDGQHRGNPREQQDDDDVTRESFAHVDEKKVLRKVGNIYFTTCQSGTLTNDARLARWTFV